MAENGLLNRAMMDNPNPLYQAAVDNARTGHYNSSAGMDALMDAAMPVAGFERDFGSGASFMPGIPPNQWNGVPPVQMPGIPRDEGVDEIAMAFKNYLTQNPHIERDAPNIDTFDAFRAGVEFGRTPVEEFGKPYVKPNIDEFEGYAEEGTPGFADPKNEYEQLPPGFSIDPNDPRNAHLNQGIPPVIMSEPIDVSDIGRRGG